MVEPSRDYFTARASTPTPTRPGRTTGDGRRFRPEEQDHSSTSPTPLSSPDFRAFASRAPVDNMPPPMEGDKVASPSARSDTSTTQTTRLRAHSGPHLAQSALSSFPTPPSTVLPSSGSTDNIHRATPQHSPPHAYYGLEAGYNPQAYSVPAQPSSTRGHNLPFAGYPSPFPNPRVGEGCVTPQNPHVRFQPMIQPHVPIYYHSHPSAPVRSHFRPVHYSQASPHFSYLQPSFPGSPPIYSYPSHHPYSPEVDTQGTWYYLPHATHHADSAGAYQSHYPSYPSISVDGEAESPAPITAQEHSAYPHPVSQEAAHSPNLVRSTPSQLSDTTHSPAADTEQSNPGNSTSGNNRRQEKSLVRKPYHPNPPAHRSEWVMWVGNIPSNASHDELWKFFNLSPMSSLTADNPTSNRQSTVADQQLGNGVVSIFLILKSSCVFVNYQTEEHLTRAIERYNGKPLRPYDPSCLRLVCRVRKRDDDLKAGVGGQRGQGLHTKWIKDQKLKEKQTQSYMSASGQGLHSQASGSSGLNIADQLTVRASDLTLSSDDEDKRNLRASHRSSSGSGSFASTDSGLLSTFFPKRYFILKSLTQYDLDLSVRHGLWATQKHNEGVLDQAYRTSKDVYLIFGVNKSGEFYGFARMTGPVQHGARNILWATRGKDLAGPRQSQRPSEAGSVESPPLSTPSFLDIARTSPNAPLTVSENEGHWADPKTPGSRRDLTSAPPELGRLHRQMSVRKPIAKSTTLPPHQAPFELDPRAPLRAIRSGVKLGDSSAENSPLVLVEEEHDQDEDIGDTESQEGIDTWGDCFKVEWLCTERLPFYWTRNLRNPWNHDREVKISRDGTELEPMVGDMLLNAWETMRAEGGESPFAVSGSTDRKGGQIRRQAGGARAGAENTSKSSGQ